MNMKIVLQKVKHASVMVEGETVGEIDHGLLLFLGITHDDTRAQADYLAEKVLKLRIFSDTQDTFMEKNVVDVSGSILIVSQFTLYGECQKGTRPSFIRAAKPDVAEPLYHYFCDALRERGGTVATGQFGAYMKVTIVNDGPITLVLEKGSSSV